MNISLTDPQAHLAAIVTSSDDAIISKDLNGIISSWNRAAERIFGYTAAEAIGRHISLIIPPERMGEEEEIIRRLRKGERIDHFETWRASKNGTQVPVSITVSPIKGANGQVVGASKVARDIGDRLEAERQLKEMAIKKDEFLANMSHELRTPMNAVIGLANILKTSKNLTERDRQFVETLKLSADNLMELINDLLDFAKIESGLVELEHVPFDLAREVEKAVSVIRVRAEEKGLDMNVQFAPTLNRFYLGDSLRVHQVLMNLLSNAVKFTERGVITVEVLGETAPGQPATDITLRVSDTGIGIAADKLETIFDKFIQADSSITRRYGGSGLGLAIAKAFVTKMGGTIAVASEESIGTRFTITLPLANTEQPTGDQASLPGLETRMVQQHKHVLLVEDYQPNVLVAGTILEQHGYSYQVAATGLEAIRHFLRGSYDVILMDVQMQDMDGLETTRRIRRVEREKGLGHTPIIAMTAHVREQDKDQCIEAGMDDFIPKPFDPAMLTEKIAQYVEPDEGAEIQELHPRH